MISLIGYIIFITATTLFTLLSAWYGLTIKIGDKFYFEMYSLRRFLKKEGEDK